MTMATGAAAGAIRILDGITQAGAVIASAALAVIVGAYAFEVVARYVFNAPTWWSAELVSYLLCIMVFTMMPAVTRAGGQVAVTVLLDRLAPAPRAVAERIIWLAGFVATAAIGWFAAGETVRQIERGVQMMAALPIPKWWISVWIGIGFGLTALQFLRLALAGPVQTRTPAPEI
ncbi:MAG: TRAP transporter small permease subunit [Pseudomonadota bacterium]|nr:TRAP transporter small permease subunit [Pseudomonadota bacterium]